MNLKTRKSKLKNVTRLLLILVLSAFVFAAIDSQTEPEAGDVNTSQHAPSPTPSIQETREKCKQLNGTVQSRRTDRGLDVVCKL